MSRQPAASASNGASSTTTAGAATSGSKHALPELLLANLRLLDLDLKPDWPSITSATFLTTASQANAKHRIKATEWILYRLFELWDPSECQDKLAPFFPPLEPLQSLNLRSALFRALNELKKNGVLGRDAVLRKTMLDECKGDKLWELLVIFSTLVLRRQDAAAVGTTRTTRARTRATAERLATAPTLSAAQQGSLVPLSVAHAASLGSILKNRQEKKQRYAQFNELLDGKRGQLRQRVKSTVTHKRRESNVNEEAHVKKVVQDNWQGSDKWAQALLAGDDSNAGDLPLQKPFDEVWEAVNEGQALGGDAGSLGLLASLDRRVQMQRERLQMWQEFHEGLRGPEYEHTRVKSESTNSTKFTFDRHQELQLGSSGSGQAQREAAPSTNAYSDILDTLRTDIADASRSRRAGGAGWSSKQEGVTPGFRGHDLFSPVKGSGAAPVSLPTKSKPIATKNNILDDRPTLLATKQPEPNGFKIKRLGRNDSKTETTLPQSRPEQPAPTPAPEVVKKQEPEPSRPLTPEMATPIKITEPSPMREEETAADRIVSSVMNATPSPIKNQMSLTERTRMSMAFFSTRGAEADDSGLGTEPSPVASEDDDTLPAIGNGKKQTDVQRRVSLLERTRLSMAAVPAQLPKSRKSIVTTRRTSLFPVNQFETPGKPRQLPEAIRDTTPTDKLFSDEAEYASVFKSRPRVALSPVPFTPELENSGLSEELELESGDEVEEETTARISPLAMRRRLAAG